MIRLAIIPLPVRPRMTDNLRGIAAMLISANGIVVVALFRYSTIPLALALGYGLWGDVPERLSFLGILIVSVAGLYLLHRERSAMAARNIKLQATADRAS